MRLSRADARALPDRLIQSSFSARYSYLYHRFPPQKHVLDDVFFRDTVRRLFHGTSGSSSEQEYFFPLIERTIQTRVKTGDPQMHPLRSFTSFVLTRVTSCPRIRDSIVSIVHTFLRNGFPSQLTPIKKTTCATFLSLLFGPTYEDPKRFLRFLEAKNCRLDAYLFVWVQTAVADLLKEDAYQYISRSVVEHNQRFYDSVAEKASFVVTRMNEQGSSLFVPKRRDMQLVEMVQGDMLRLSPYVGTDNKPFTMSLQTDIHNTCLTRRRSNSISHKPYRSTAFQLLKKTPDEVRYQFMLLLHRMQNHSVVPLSLLFRLVSRPDASQALWNYVIHRNPSYLNVFTTEEAMYAYNFLTIRRIQLEKIQCIPTSHEERDKVRNALFRRFGDHESHVYELMVRRATTLVGCASCQTVLSYHRANNGLAEKYKRHGCRDVEMRVSVPVCCERNKHTKKGYDIHTNKSRRRSKTIPKCCPCVELQLLDERTNRLYKASWFGRIYYVCHVCGCLHDDSMPRCSIDVG